SLLEGAAWPTRNRDRLLYETWAHVASLVPVGIEPLLRWRQDRFRSQSWGRVDAVRRDHPGFLDTVLAVIDERGPSSAGDIEKALQAPGRGISGWWEWSITKTSCEYLFAAGIISVAYRRGFERCYDLTERVLPRSVLDLPTPSEPDAKRSLTALAARSHGIGTVADLADYYRIAKAETRVALDELIEDGKVIPVQVDGWAEPGYLHRDARIPRRVAGSALLCPFDPLIWERARTERLFDLRYRIEIYTPAPKRQFGYYVFPLLVGEELVGRFDVKADRSGSRLLVQASWLEEGADPRAAAEAAANELTKMATWLDLAEIVVLPRGNFWSTLTSRSGMVRGVLADGWPAA
ncbi:MAG: crosslink repair DNA glycosylase YcaQ family protein, partial [Nakamurella sp.]